jgi:hypothetical protein
MKKLILVLFAVLLMGCGSSKETKEEPKEEVKEEPKEDSKKDTGKISYDELDAKETYEAMITNMTNGVTYYREEQSKVLYYTDVNNTEVASAEYVVSGGNVLEKVSKDYNGMGNIDMLSTNDGKNRYELFYTAMDEKYNYMVTEQDPSDPEVVEYDRLHVYDEFNEVLDEKRTDNEDGSIVLTFEVKWGEGYYTYVYTINGEGFLVSSVMTAYADGTLSEQEYIDTYEIFDINTKTTIDTATAIAEIEVKAEELAK